MFNHVFAAQDAETGTCRYHTPPDGCKPEGYFHGPDCCTASGHRIISLLPTFFYAHKGIEYYINQYTDALYQSKDLSFTISGNYPENEMIMIKISSPKAITRVLNLRIPSWCENPQVKVNGSDVSNVSKTGYLRLYRTWKPGDVVELSLPMKATWIQRTHHSVYHTHSLQGGELMYEEEPTDNIPYAFVRGPIVYCADMVWNKQISNDDMNIDSDLRIDVNKQPTMTACPSSSLMGPMYKTSAWHLGNPVIINLVPFANIGQWFRLGEAKPQRDTKAFTYAIWLYKK
jgi:DUF1680 family protein